MMPTRAPCTGLVSFRGVVALALWLPHGPLCCVLPATVQFYLVLSNYGAVLYAVHACNNLQQAGW